MHNMNRTVYFFATLTLCLALAGGAWAAGLINGAGATFPYPLYSRWAYDYNAKTGVKLNYQSIGSGGGVKQIQARTVDFGASDAPLEPSELEASGLIQFPMAVGGVVPVVNIPGVKPGPLSLSPEVLPAIFTGGVKEGAGEGIGRGAK